MAFCENCGASLNDKVRFCSSCGTPAGAGTSSGVSNGSIPAPGASEAAKPASSPALKILLVAVSVLVFVALLGVGAIVYVGYRVHKKVQEVSQVAADPTALLSEIAKNLPNSGANSLPNLAGLSAGTSPQPAQQNPTPIKLEARHITEKDGQCALFTKEELTQVLGDAFTHADADATGCTYKGDAPRQFVRTEILWKGGRKMVGDVKSAYEFLAKRQDPKSIPQQPFPGVGDEAFVNLFNVVRARKADVGLTIDLRYYHDSDDLTKQIVIAAFDRVAGT